jgi:hypothetical protein
MLSPRLFPNGVAFEIIRLHADLGTDKIEHARGDQLSGVQQATRMPERTELEGKTQPVLWATAGTDMLDIIIIQGVVPQESHLAGWQVEEGGPLAIRQHMTSGHKGFPEMSVSARGSISGRTAARQGSPQDQQESVSYR